jgi:hypothetical protein
MIYKLLQALQMQENLTLHCTQLVDDRMCGATGPLSDDCDEAIEINMAGIVCEDIPCRRL